MEERSICESCYKATNEKYCPFVATLKKIKGWKFNKDGKRIECPLYLYDYDFPKVEKFLREMKTPLEEIKSKMARQHRLYATLEERENSHEQGYDYIDSHYDDGSEMDVPDGNDLLALLKEVLYGDEV